MYELKKNGKLFTDKLVGKGPRLMKKNLLVRGLTKFEKYSYKAFYCSRLILGFPESNPIAGMDIRLLCLLCVV